MRTIEIKTSLRCDACGAEVHIAYADNMPKNWTTVQLGVESGLRKSAELCEKHDPWQYAADCVAACCAVDTQRVRVTIDIEIHTMLVEAGYKITKRPGKLGGPS